MLGSAESEYPRLTNCDIIFEDFQPMWYGQTTCRSNTVLCVASRGNDRDRAPGQGSALLVTFVVVCKFYTPLPVPRHGTGPRLFHLQCDSCKFDTVLQSRSLDGTKSPRKNWTQSHHTFNMTASCYEQPETVFSSIRKFHIQTLQILLENSKTHYNTAMYIIDDRFQTLLVRTVKLLRQMWSL